MQNVNEAKVREYIDVLLANFYDLAEDERRIAAELDALPDSALPSTRADLFSKRFQAWGRTAHAYMVWQSARAFFGDE